MILDKLLQFDPAASALTVTRDSTNVLDLLNARDISLGAGPDLLAVVTVGTAFTAAGAATLTISIQSSADNITYALLVQTNAIPVASLTANKVIQIPLPGILANPAALMPRYLKLIYTVATGPMLTGDLEADLAMNPQSNNVAPLNYPAGITVSN